MAKGKEVISIKFSLSEKQQFLAMVEDLKLLEPFLSIKGSDSDTQEYWDAKQRFGCINQIINTVENWKFRQPDQENKKDKELNELGIKFFDTLFKTKDLQEYGAETRDFILDYDVSNVLIIKHYINQYCIVNNLFTDAEQKTINLDDLLYEIYCTKKRAKTDKSTLKRDGHQKKIITTLAPLLLKQ